MEINKKLETFYLRLEFGKKCVVNGKRHTHMMSISLGLGFRQTYGHGNGHGHWNGYRSGHGNWCRSDCEYYYGHGHQNGHGRGRAKEHGNELVMNKIFTGRPTAWKVKL